MFDFFKKRREEQFQQHKATAEDAYHKQQNKSVAVKELALALKAKPSCFETWCQYGDWSDALASEYMLKDNMEMSSTFRERAETAIKKSLEINPKYALGYYRLANLYWGTDFRKALVEYENAANLDDQYSKDVEHAKSVVAQCTHKLNELEVYRLHGLRSEPLPRIYDQEFYFEDTPIGAAVIDACWFGGDVQRTHVWRFRSELPDLSKDEPIGVIATIRSDGRVGVIPGCPSNWSAIIDNCYKEGNIEISKVI